MKVENKASIVVFSGTLDKLLFVFNTGNACAASGMDVYLYFTFGGLIALKKDGPLGSHLPTEEPPENQNFSLKSMSNGKSIEEVIKQAMASPGIQTLPEMLADAKDLGVKLAACGLSMEMLGISRSDLIDEVDEVVGVATYVNEAANSSIGLFI